MTTKVLLDCIVTTREPSRCSSVIQFYTFVQRTLAEREDVFFYWMLPEWVSEEEKAWLPQDPRVRYVPVRQHRDRMNEYIALHDDMRENMSFNGDYWDFDVILTTRTGLVPLMKMNAIGPKQHTVAWTKEVWVIEEMPLMGFKKSVAMINPQVQDLFTLQGYLAADRVWTISYHEKAAIVQAARQYFAPTVVRSLDTKLVEVVPTQKEEFLLKDKSFFFDMRDERPFCVAYVGRMMAAQSNLDKVYSAMTNHWVMRGSGKVRLLVMTVSGGGQAAWPPDHIEVQRAPREEFWRVTKEEMHLMVMLYQEGGFSLSLIEPMMNGVPALVLEADWSRALLGRDYPFFVKSELEVYALMKMFYEDYAGMYERYAAWFEEVFTPMFRKRFADDLLYNRLSAEVARIDHDLIPRYAEVTGTRSENAIVAAVAKHVEDKDQFVLFEVLHKLAESGVLESLQRKLKDGDREKRGLVWSTGWNEYRLLLKAHHGWEDASTTVGHMRRKTVAVQAEPA